MSKFPKLFEGHYDYLLQEVLESIDDAVLVFEHNLTVVYANKAADDVFGSLASTLTGRNIKQLIAKDRQRYFTEIIASLKDSEHHSVELIAKKEFEGLRANGHIFYAEGKLAKFKNESAYILVLRDITWRKAVEGELQTALAHLKIVGSKAGYRLERPRILDEFPLD
jgi:PAS domain S-box-containing protein